MNRFRRMFSRNKLAAEVSEEMRQHLDEKIDALIADGMPREEAVHAAQRAFGNSTLIEQRSREVWMWPLVESIWADVKFALRQLRKSPGFTVIAVLTLSLGIGATTLIFSLVYGGVIEPFPYTAADRIVEMAFMGKKGVRGFMALNEHEAERLRKAPVVEDVMLSGFADPTTTINGYPEDVEVAELSGNAFHFLGVAPLLGRVLTSQDRGHEVAVLGYDFCKSHFHCDASVLGRTVDLDRRKYTIVGVMPARFVWAHANVYAPLPWPMNDEYLFATYLRIRPNAKPDLVSAEVLTFVRQFVLETDHIELPIETRMEPVGLLQGSGGIATQLKLLFAAVTMLLLIACANVSILMLGRTAAREHEFQIQRALGASDIRILRQVLTNALVLAGLGGMLGIALTYVGLEFLRIPLVKNFLPSEAVLRINIWVMFFSVAVTSLTGALVGLLPGLRLCARWQKNNHLQAAHTIGARGLGMSHRMLIAGQVATTLLLLVCAGAAIHTLIDLYRTDLGYDPHHILEFRLPSSIGNRWEQRMEYYSRLRQRLQSIPGIQQASLDEATATSGGFQGGYMLPGQDFGPAMDSRMPRADLEFVDAHFLTAMRIPIVLGRAFDQRDFEQAESVALLSRSFARQLFGTQNPIGKILIIPALTSGYAGVARPEHPQQKVQVIGLTGDVRPGGVVGAIPRQTIYLPESLFTSGSSTRAYVRVNGDPIAMLNTVRKAVKEIDPYQPISQARSLDDVVREDFWSRNQWLAWMFGAFSVIALFLSASGIYSVVAYAAIQRGKELGLRMALGANRSSVLRLMMLSEMKAVLVGLAFGILASAGVQRMLRIILNAHTGDTWLLPVSALILMIVAGVASFIPARRASKIDPMQALRAE